MIKHCELKNLWSLENCKIAIQRRNHKKNNEQSSTHRHVRLGHWWPCRTRPMMPDPSPWENGRFFTTQGKKFKVYRARPWPKIPLTHSVRTHILFQPLLGPQRWRGQTSARARDPALPAAQRHGSSPRGRTRPPRKPTGPGASCFKWSTPRRSPGRGRPARESRRGILMRNVGETARFFDCRTFAGPGGRTTGAYRAGSFRRCKKAGPVARA